MGLGKQTTQKSQEFSKTKKTHMPPLWSYGNSEQLREKIIQQVELHSGDSPRKLSNVLSNL